MTSLGQFMGQLRPMKNGVVNIVKKPRDDNATGVVFTFLAIWFILILTGIGQFVIHFFGL